MRTRLLIFAAILFLAVSAVFSVIRAQDTPAATSPDHAQHSLAVNLLRAINTAENDYRCAHNGAYAPWETLVTSPEFTTKGLPWAERMEPALADAQFATGAEILPGWRLRLDLTSGGAGYDALLEDATDTTSGYAVVTDERALIRECRTVR